MSKRLRISMDVISGIYSITNKKNNKKYIGSSKDIYGRWIQHIKQLNDNKHHSSHLQYAWNKYGKDNFDFEIIEKCSIEELMVREQYWYDIYNSGDDLYGYNMSKISRCPSPNATLKTLKEGRQTITFNQFQKIIYLLSNSDMSIPNIANKLNAPERTIYQIYFKEEYCELTKECNFIQRKFGNVQKLLSEEDVIEIVKRLKNNDFNSDIANDYGVGKGTIADIRQHKTWTYLTKDITFDSLVGRQRPPHKRVVQYDEQGHEINRYESATDASKITGVGHKLISQVCHGEKRIAHGFIWRFENDPFDKYEVENTHQVKVDKYDLSGKYIETFSSVVDANNSIASGNVNSVINKKTKSAGGFYWVRHNEKFIMPKYERNR